MTTDARSRWIEELGKEDLDFLREFVLASGSLKELARCYQISYPTVRLRLDRLIETVRNASEESEASPLESELQRLTVRGEISSTAARQILAAHEKTLKESEPLTS